MKNAQYHAVIFEVNGITTQVEVFTDRERAEEMHENAGGRLISGVDNIVNACNWWHSGDSMAYRRRWVYENAI
ncbi:MAG: hypothetical protein NC226_09475 [Bacteroides cellulosilyticus]|nr:hypothetical protein [Bacteroides cellulosilyticus]